MAMTDIARGSCNLAAMVKNLEQMALGQPMYRYKNADGKTCVSNDPPPEGSTDIREAFPDFSDQMAATKYIWERLEPVTKQVAITHSRGLDAQSAYNLGSFTPEKLNAFIELTGELSEADSEQPADDAGSNTGSDD